MDPRGKEGTEWQEHMRELKTEMERVSQKWVKKETAVRIKGNRRVCPESVQP